MISVGTNDFLENYYPIPGRSSQYTIREYENFLVGIARNFTKELYDLGAPKNIVRRVVSNGVYATGENGQSYGRK